MSCSKTLQYLERVHRDAPAPDVADHLAHCASCQARADSIPTLDRRIGHALAAIATGQQPAADALARFERRITTDGRSRGLFTLRRGTMTRKRFALTTLGLALLTLTAVAFSPPVRAEITDRVMVFFAVAPQFIGTAAPIAVPSPAYLPASFRDQAAFSWQAGTRVEWDGRGAPPIPDTVTQLYHDDERFVRITRQTRSTGPLPAGTAVDINGRAGRLTTGASGTVEWPVAPSIPAPSVTPQQVELRMRTLSYRNGLELTWDDDQYRYVLVSNLSEDELLKVARALR